VRDCDIQIKELSAAKKSPRRLLKAISRTRRRARKDLKAVVHRATRGERLKKKSDRLLETIDPACHQPFGDFVQAAIAPLAHDFITAALADLSDDASLHALRIAAKRWRYALELAASALHTPGVRELYDNLSEVQDRLGALHDQIELNKRVEDHLLAATHRRRRRKLRCLLARQREGLAAQREALRHWWTPARRQQLASQWQQASARRSTA
jgi:CHAD domain-containing protein